MNDENMKQQNLKKSDENDKKKMSMADRFITAMFLPGEYPALMKLGVGKIISFLVFLVLLLSLIQYAIPSLAKLAGYGGVRSYIINELPDFSLKNGELFVSEKYKEENSDAGIYILVDTDVDAFTEDDVDRDMVQVWLVSRTNMLIYNNVSGLTGMIQKRNFSEFGNVTINNESIADMAPIMYICMVLVFVTLYLFTMVEYLVSSLFYALILFMLSRIMSGGLSFGAIYKIALFAQTTGAIVSAVANYIGTPVFVMAGSTFAMIVTVLIMNRAYFKIVPPPKAL